jgi:hypothetical protein
MRKRLQMPLAILVAILLGGIAWQGMSPSERVLRGKPENEWIRSIAYFGDKAQLQQWRELGPEGLKLLASRLDQGRRYRTTHRWLVTKLPGAISKLVYRHLPNPTDAHESRMCVVSLLNQLGTDALPVEPAIAHALNDDDSGVRMGALACYEELLLAMGEKEKAARLPEFLRALRDSDSGIRSNAAVALRFYSGQTQGVVPALVKALRDPVVAVRLMSAKALAKIDVQTADRAGVVAIAVQILSDPSDQVASQAADLLVKMGIDPIVAVSALAESVQRGKAAAPSQQR